MGNAMVLVAAHHHRSDPSRALARLVKKRVIQVYKNCLEDLGQFLYLVKKNVINIGKKRQCLYCS